VDMFNITGLEGVPQPCNPVEIVNSRAFTRFLRFSPNLGGERRHNGWDVQRRQDLLSDSSKDKRPFGEAEKT
jgi:hypothetical protein